MTEINKAAIKMADIAQEEENMMQSGSHNRGADVLKFLLGPFVCFWDFGFPDGGTGIVSMLSGFAIPAFFILSGYFVLEPEKQIRQEKLKRAVRRSFQTFALMFICYFLINAAILTAQGVEWLPALGSRRLLFNFFVLNIWPYEIGNNIWFIQSLLYAYIFLFLADRLGLLRYYKILLAVLYAAMLLLGEFAGVVGFHVLGYSFIPGGAVTRALSYLLAGMLLREKNAILLKISKKYSEVYLVVFAAGAVLVIGEVYLLSSVGKLVSLGHMLGDGVMAVAACGWAVTRTKMNPNQLSIHGRNYAKRIYALSNPLGYTIVWLVLEFIPDLADIASSLLGVVVYLLCLLFCVLITALKTRKERNT